VLRNKANTEGVVFDEKAAGETQQLKITNLVYDFVQEKS